MPGNRCTNSPALAESIRAHVAPAALGVFAWLTHAGDPAVLSVLGVLVFVALWRRRHRTLALAWTVALAGNALLKAIPAGTPTAANAANSALRERQPVRA